MAPPGPTVRKRDYAKEDAKRFDGDYYRLPPVVLSIVIVVSLVFFWVRHLYYETIFHIGGLQPISRERDDNAAMYNCWWTNKRS